MVTPVMPLLEALRIRQWLKNVVVFAPLVFAGRFFEPNDIAATVSAFIILSIASSAVYLLNDARDAAEDRAHPTKKHRAVARGALSVRLAYVAAAAFFLSSVVAAYALSSFTAIALIGFFAVNAIYSFGGKCVAILDVMLIGASFVLRVLVGAAAIAVPASLWLLLTLFFLASYLGFTKRGAELRSMGAAARAALRDYTPTFLDHARSATLAVTLALYTLYSFSSPFGSAMAVTTPFVFFGLLRYQAIVDRDDGKNNGPADHIYLDRQLQLAVVFWGVAVLCVILFHV